MCKRLNAVGTKFALFTAEGEWIDSSPTVASHADVLRERLRGRLVLRGSDDHSCLTSELL